MSDTSIGDELTVVGHVTWGIARQGPVDESCNFEHDVLPHRKPVQLAEHMQDDPIAWCLSQAWQQRSELSAGSTSVRR